MEVKVHIPFQELLTIVKQLSPSQKAKLQKELAKDIGATPKKSRLTQLLLHGPVFSEDQINAIQETRNLINQWRNEP